MHGRSQPELMAAQQGGCETCPVAAGRTQPPECSLFVPRARLGDITHFWVAGILDLLGNRHDGMNLTSGCGSLVHMPDLASRSSINDAVFLPHLRRLQRFTTRASRHGDIQCPRTVQPHNSSISPLAHKTLVLRLSATSLFQHSPSPRLR